MRKPVLAFLFVLAAVVAPHAAFAISNPLVSVQMTASSTPGYYCFPESSLSSYFGTSIPGYGAAWDYAGDSTNVTAFVDSGGGGTILGRSCEGGGWYDINGGDTNSYVYWAQHYASTHASVPFYLYFGYSNTAYRSPWYSGTTGSGIYGTFYVTNSGIAQIYDSSTRIQPVSPLLANQTSTTTPSGTINFSTNYYYNSTTQPYGSYDELALLLNRTDAASSTLTVFPGITKDTLTSTSTTLTLPDNSQWTQSWCFLDSSSGSSAYCTTQQTINVLSDPTTGYFGTSTDNLTGLATSTCSVLNITGCFQNAVSFLFYPNPSVLNSYQTLTSNIKTHAPFGYVYTLQAAITNTSGSASPDFTLDIATSTQAQYFDPIKNGIAAILWALAAFWFFRRIRDLNL